MTPMSQPIAAQDVAEQGTGAQDKAEQDTAEHIPFEEFRNGLRHGRFHVIVNPVLAAPFVAQCTRATPLALGLIGAGIAAALVGHPWTGGLLVAVAALLRRLVKAQAPRTISVMSRARAMSPRAESLRVFRSCPLITPKHAHSSLQMRAIARAMAVLCA